jgi:hypothetical protein
MYMQQPGGTPGGTPGGVRGTQPGGNEGKGFQTPFPGGDPNGGFGGKKKFGDGGGFPGGMVPGINPSVALNPDAVNQQADMDFRRRDNNGDGRLAIEEVPQDMRRTFLKWDKNADGFIMVDEYREFFMARAMGSLDEMSGSKGVASIIVDEEELDRKTVVIRAGKLPTGLPEWFSELDYDKDGQVALWEWRKGGKSVEDFGGIWDLNDDGFITPEEALRSQSTIARNSKNGDGTSQSANGDNRSKGKGKWGGFGGDPNGGGNGERPAWGPGGMFPGGGGGGMFPGGGGGKDGGGKKGKKGGG